MNRTAKHLLSTCNWSASELSEADGRFTEVTNIADFELEEIDCNFEDIPELLRALSPGIIKFELDAEQRYLIIVGSRRGNLILLGREEELVKIPVRAIADIVKQPVEAGHTQLVSPLLKALSCSPADVGAIRDALVSQRCANERISGFWTIRPKQLGFREVLRNERISQLVLKLFSAHCLFYLLFLGSWILIGRGLISGRFDSGWIVAWVLALTLTLPVRALSLWLEGQLAISLSSLVKQFLLKGITNVDPSVVRTQGSGGMLGLVLEAEALESVAISGGLLLLLGAVELFATACSLSFGLGAGLMLFLLVAWSCILLAAVVRNFLLRGRWVESRLGLTTDLVDRLLGHRTRLVQLLKSLWHQKEDEPLALYFKRGSALDRSDSVITSLLSRGWVVIAILGIFPQFIFGQPTHESLAITLGAIALGKRAFQSIGSGFSSLAQATIAWNQASPLFKSSFSVFRSDSFSKIITSEGSVADDKLQDTPDYDKDLVFWGKSIEFGYPSSSVSLVKNSDLEIHGDSRILVTGPSGVGKSTFAQVLAGLHPLRSGILLLRGLDFQTLGSQAWRKHVALAPQFYQNHIFSGTLAFNLLMGRAWPPSSKDAKEAISVARALGLGDLLDRMPAGILQMVGETGWRLSHGESSRVFLARALLQNPDLLILDENFASLDPLHLKQAIDFVRACRPALLVIAHP